MALGQVGLETAAECDRKHHYAERHEGTLDTVGTERVAAAVLAIGVEISTHAVVGGGALATLAA